LSNASHRRKPKPRAATRKMGKMFWVRTSRTSFTAGGYQVIRWKAIKLSGYQVEGNLQLLTFNF
jgi:hypothetical protein